MEPVNALSGKFTEKQQPWKTVPIENLVVSVASGRSYPNATFGSFPVYGSTGVIGYTNDPMYEGEGVIVARVGANAGKITVVQGKYGVTDNAILIKITPSIPLQYFWRQLEAMNLNSMVFGSGQPLITGTQIKALSIPIPSSRGEQEAIAGALSDVDALIESLEKLIAKKRLIKQGVMQDFLTGKRRLPGYQKYKNWKETEFGRIPGDWKVETLFNVCRFKSGKAHERFVTDNGKYICVNSKFISTDSEIKKYSSENFCPAKKNDILMVMSDLPNGRALAKVFMVDRDDTYAVNQRVCILSPYKDNPRFLGLVLNRNPYFLKFDDGVSQTHLLNRVFEKCPVVLPEDVNEQREIADVVDSMSSEIDALEMQLKKTQLLKQGMMQELLTGRIRLV